VLLAAMAVAALLLAGSWGGEASAGGTATASKAKIVDIKNFVFRPATLTIGAGSSVVFANSSGVSHTATRAGFDTGTIKPGKSVTVRFAKRGSFPYHCTIHPFMHGKIVVD
jgi:plastocyanin